MSKTCWPGSTNIAVESVSHKPRPRGGGSLNDPAGNRAPGGASCGRNDLNGLRAQGRSGSGRVPGCSSYLRILSPTTSGRPLRSATDHVGLDPRGTASRRVHGHPEGRRGRSHFRGHALRAGVPPPQKRCRLPLLRIHGRRYRTGFPEKRPVCDPGIHSAGQKRASVRLRRKESSGPLMPARRPPGCGRTPIISGNGATPTYPL